MANKTYEIVLQLKVEGVSKEAEAIARIEQELTKLNNTRKYYLDLVKQGHTLGKVGINELAQTEASIKSLNVQKQSLNTTMTQAARLQQAETGTMNNLRARNAELRKAMNELNLTTAEGVRKMKDMKSEYDVNIKKIRDFDRALSGSKTLVGEYGRAFGATFNTMGKAAAGFFTVNAAFGVLKNAFNVYAEFDKKSANLAAILEKSKGDIKFLADQAKELGSTSVFTASEITQLQTELAKLGFTDVEISKSTKAVMALAAATDYSIELTAELTGSVLRMYELDASEMQRVTDVLGRGTTMTALSMSKLATAMPYVGKSADLAGVSLERTVALLGVLSNRGVDASIAGTSLRNIFIELAKKGLTWEQAMGRIRNAMGDGTNKTKANAVAFELFGKRGAAASLILATTTAETDKLTEAFVNSKGAVMQMSEVILDNVTGSLKLAKTAWQGFILSIEDGSGTLSTVIRGAIELFGDFFTMLRKANEGESIALQKLKMDSDYATQVAKKYEEITKAVMLATSDEEVYATVIAKRLDLQNKIRSLEYSAAQLEKDKKGFHKERILELQFERDAYIDLVKKIEDDYLPIIKKMGRGAPIASQVKTTGLNEDEGTTGGEGKDANKEAEKKIKATEQMVDMINKLNVQLIENEIIRANAEVEVWRKQEIKKVDESVVSEKLKSEAKTVINQTYLKKLTDIAEKSQADWLEQDKKDAEEKQKLDEDRLKKEEEHAQRVKEIREKYGLVTTEESRFNELLELQTLFSQKLISWEEYFIALAILQGKWDKEEEDKDKKKEKLKEKGKLMAYRGLKDVAASYYSYLDVQMEEELLKAGKNAQKKAQIQKEYGEKKRMFAYTSAIINAAEGVTKIWAEFSTMPMIAWALTAIEALATGIQIATIKKQKFATGGVIESGNELPNTPRGVDNTLILAKPGEVILNESQQIRAGGADFFKRIGVPGFATGGVIGGIPSPAANDSTVSIDAMVSGISNQMKSLKVVLNVNELHDAEDELSVILQTSGL